jgi:hypothetical protein
MVAAWIKALTGVGPSIASGSQTCSGTWADFPTTPKKIRKVRRLIAWEGISIFPNSARPS